MFKKVKLKTYLFIVFAAIIFQSGLSTIIGIYGLDHISQNTDKLISEILTADAAVKNCRIQSNIAARDLREMLLTDNPADHAKFKESINQSMAIIKEEMDIFRSTYSGEDDLVDKYQKSFDAWFDIATRAINEIEKGNKEQATQIVLNECSPALNEMVGIVREIDAKTSLQKLDQQDYTAKAIKVFMMAAIVIFVIILVISIFFALKTTVNITDAVQKLKDAVIELSKGNLSAKVDYEAQNEFGELAERMNFSFKELDTYVKAVDETMEEFSKGNFTHENTVNFLGDFVHIQTSVANFQKKMNTTLAELEAASYEVSMGSSQVENGAQTLADGASEQASSVEELSATIAEVSGHISNTAEYMQKADALGKETNIVVQKSQNEMEQMLQAIKDIADASENIQKIIKAIDDIAFQTNILALNAAVEAARAGTAGKGFAVVADEVRNLAQKAAEAAKSTAELIENSMKHVEHGGRLAWSTNEAFNEVAQKSEEILSVIAKVAQASTEQAASMSQITQGVEQISAVIQTNSATSEQSAAASQTLNGQAQMMKSLLDQFTLSEDSSKIY